MPKAIKKKTKKKITGAEIEVKDRLSGLQKMLKKRQKTVLFYGITAVVIILAVAGIFLYQNMADENARRLEYEAYTVYYGEYQKFPMQHQDRFQKALDLFKQAYAKKKSARVLLYIANSYSELGRFDEALTALNDFVKTYSSDKDLLPLAYKETADIQLKKGNTNEALKTLDTLYKSPAPFYRDFALLESAKILETMGRKEEAVAKYKELTEKFKDSPFIEDAQSRLSEKKES
jgi:predicted negative regulator of RcsB-dependent stress response